MRATLRSDLSAPDEDVEQTARVVPLTPIQVVVQPGAVKLVHRSGRVLHAFAGATVWEDVESLASQLCDILGSRTMRREVLQAKPWWRFWR